MQISEFIEATGRLEKYYDKEYNNEQRKIMFEELKEINIDRYKILISSVIKKCKFLPKIADIIEANNEEPYSNNLNNKEKIECEKCNSTGYIIYTKIINDGTRKLHYQYASICDCGNAKQYKGWEITDERFRNNYYTPLAKDLGLLN